MSPLHRTFVWPYNPKSESAKALADALDVLRVKSEGSVLKGAPDLFIVNFGSGGNYFPSFLKGSTIINSPNAVLKAVNKADFFDIAEGTPGLRIPEWTTIQSKAKAWLNKGETVLARQELEGSNGSGIVVMTKVADMVSAPLYTQFIENSKEFRLYVVDGKVVFTCTKDPKSGVKQTSQLLRTTDHGWAYNYYYGAVPQDAINQAIAAVKACGLDFGGVDLVMSGTKAYVLEVNTAPWMGETIATPVAVALRALLVARGALTKAQVEAATPAQAPAPTVAPTASAALDGKTFTFTATFTAIQGSWGTPKGSTHKETFKTVSWIKALAEANTLVQTGWTLTELKAA